MAVARPLYLQGLTDYTASEFRGLTDALYADPGIKAGLDVAASAPAGMSVIVSPGYAVIAAATAVGGKYLYRVTAAETAFIAASGAQPRIDLIVGRVRDTEFAGVVDAGDVFPVPGVPGAVPAAPALPASCVLLATVAVRAGTASILTADLTPPAFRLISGQRGDLGYSDLAINADTCLTPGTVSGTVTGRGVGLLTTDLAAGSLRQTFANTASAPIIWTRTRSGGVWTAWTLIGPTARIGATMNLTDAWSSTTQRTHTGTWATADNVGMTVANSSTPITVVTAGVYAVTLNFLSNIAVTAKSWVQLVANSGLLPGSQPTYRSTLSIGDIVATSAFTVPLAAGATFSVTSNLITGSGYSVAATLSAYRVSP